MHMEVQGRTLDELELGEKAVLRRKITEEDIQRFAEATGDVNPLHLDEDYAKNTVFKGRIAHGMLVASLFSNIIGTRFPGPGTVYVSQTLAFKRPVKINDTITAEVEVHRIDRDKERVVLYTSCRNQDGDIVLDGEAIVSPKKAGAR